MKLTRNPSDARCGARIEAVPAALIGLVRRIDGDQARTVGRHISSDPTSSGIQAVLMRRTRGHHAHAVLDDGATDRIENNDPGERRTRLLQNVNYRVHLVP